MLTLYSIGIYLLLLVINFGFAGIAHHAKWFTPVWLLAMFVNKMAALAIPVCIVIDIISLF